MPKGQRRKISSLRRRVHLRQPKVKFMLVCEGKNTEPDYFKALRQSYPNTLFDFDMRGGVGVPETIANQATDLARRLGLAGARRRKKESFEEKDQVWAIFDRDNHPNFLEAIQRCKNNGVRVARSNPCFEIWLILHFENFNRPDDRHVVQKHLEKLAPEYDPNGSKTLNFPELIKSFGTARDRAVSQLANREAEGDPFGRPSTTVYELIDEIEKLQNPKKVEVKIAQSS